MNPGSSVIDPRSYVTAPAAGATRSIFDPRTVTTTFRCTARPSKTCAARIVTGTPACCAGRLVAPATRISNQVRRRLVIGFTCRQTYSGFVFQGRKCSNDAEFYYCGPAHFLQKRLQAVPEAFRNGLYLTESKNRGE